MALVHSCAQALVSEVSTFDIQCSQIDSCWLLGCGCSVGCGAGTNYDAGTCPNPIQATAQMYVVVCVHVAVGLQIQIARYDTSALKQIL